MFLVLGRKAMQDSSRARVKNCFQGSDFSIATHTLIYSFSRPIGTTTEHFEAIKSEEDVEDYTSINRKTGLI